MHFVKRSVQLSDTDATGVVYFTNQLKFAAEAFENFLKTSGLPLNFIFEHLRVGLPIVHTESEFNSPLYLGEILTLHLKITSIGINSFTYNVEIQKNGLCAGKVTTTHVALSLCSKKKTRIPEDLKAILHKILF